MAGIVNNRISVPPLKSSEGFNAVCEALQCCEKEVRMSSIFSGMVGDQLKHSENHVHRFMENTLRTIGPLVIGDDKQTAIHTLAEELSYTADQIAGFGWDGIAEVNWIESTLSFDEKYALMRKHDALTEKRAIVVKDCIKKCIPLPPPPEERGFPPPPSSRWNMPIPMAPNLLSSPLSPKQEW